MTRPQATVLILGARGRLGLAAARAFAQAGWRVCGQIRPGAPAPAVPGVEWLAHDLQDTAGLAAAARGARVVVHALNPAYTVAAWREQAPGLMAAALALATGLRATLMLPGNVYNYGEDMPAVLQEATPQRPRHELGRIRVALEQQMAQAVEDSGAAMRAVVVRAGNFFGASEGTFLDKMVAPQLTRGKASWMGDLDVSTPWAYLPDLARTLVMLAERDDLAPFEDFHFAGHQVSARQWLAVLSQVAQEQGWLQPGQALTVRRVPAWFSGWGRTPARPSNWLCASRWWRCACPWQRRLRPWRPETGRRAAPQPLWAPSNSSRRRRAWVTVAWRTAARLPSKRCTSLWVWPRKEKPNHTVPTGLAALPPLGPATPVTATDTWALPWRRAPSAMASATGSLTAPCRAISASGTPSSSVLASFE